MSQIWHSPQLTGRHLESCWYSDAGYREDEKVYPSLGLGLLRPTVARVGCESVWSLAKLAYGLVIHSPLHEAVPPQNHLHFASL